MKLRNTLVTALALGALVALSPFSRAQENKESSPSQPPAAGQRARRGGNQNQFQRIAEQLKLTDEQKTKLQPIYQEEATKLRELRQDTSLNNEQRREKSREIRTQYEAKMKPILTTEQFDQLKKLRQGGGRRGGGGQGGSSNNNSNR